MIIHLVYKEIWHFYRAKVSQDKSMLRGHNREDPVQASSYTGSSYKRGSDPYLPKRSPSVKGEVNPKIRISYRGNANATLIPLGDLHCTILTKVGEIDSQYQYRINTTGT